MISIRGARKKCGKRWSGDQFGQPGSYNPYPVDWGLAMAESGACSSTAEKVAETKIPRTMAFDYSLDETFDIGCDKGAPVTNEYRALAAFTGRIVKVDMDLSPDFAFDAELHATAHAQSAMMRQ